VRRDIDHPPAHTLLPELSMGIRERTGRGGGEKVHVSADEYGRPVSRE
jgi:hypothetical protein